ncbi:conserved hypothetical protein [Desulfamplus magnetovallimortis]|uniref:DUF2760 domain-containing protein n=1 Tax=Desulfamplus magnetovallimortis TaxID=1246637 RepID=A0A1W1HC92_9BACT|nr:DUF2760 domain-containing protein [Desulfamplus magnetovallimortis]SLM30005.1 conserved hypothetical protein [Desulfamplus magnetovallimortis]
MEGTKAYATRSLVVITLLMMLCGGLTGVGLYFGLKHLLQVLTPGTGAAIVIPGIDVKIMIQSLSDVAHSVEMLLINYFSWIVPSVAAFCLIISLVLWFVLKLSVSSLFANDTNSSTVKTLQDLPEKEVKKEYADQKIEQERKKRIFLHFLSVLQREGRLLDFFAEDLSLYDDEQIGSAVRSIQEDCKKTVEKYLGLAPVIDEEEGESIDVPSGFDPDAIKLTGNVSGEPPFRGILRHRGWKAAKKDVPRLADVRDPSIISPAEVELE